LDALCKRFGISLSSRDKHGAIVDSELLAAVYLELNGGRERSLGLDPAKRQAPEAAKKTNPAKQRPASLPPRLTALEKQAHIEFIEALAEKTVWEKVRRRERRA